MYILSLTSFFRSIIGRRFFFIVGTLYLYRCITMYITTLPVPGMHFKCSPKVEYIGILCLSLEACDKENMKDKDNVLKQTSSLILFLLIYFATHFRRLLILKLTRLIFKNLNHRFYRKSNTPSNPTPKFYLLFH